MNQNIGKDNRGREQNEPEQWKRGRDFVRCVRTVEEIV